VVQQLPRNLLRCCDCDCSLNRLRAETKQSIDARARDSVGVGVHPVSSSATPGATSNSRPRVLLHPRRDVDRSRGVKSTTASPTFPTNATPHYCHAQLEPRALVAAVTDCLSRSIPQDRAASVLRTLILNKESHDLVANELVNHRVMPQKSPVAAM